MRNIGWRTGVAIVAGLLTLAGTRTLADSAATTSGMSNGGSNENYDSRSSPRAGETRTAPSKDHAATSDPASGGSTTDGSTMGSTSGSTSGAMDRSPTASSSRTRHQDQLVGRVDSFDRSTNTLTLSGTPVKIDSSTDVTKDGARASINDIKEGDQVRASFSGSGDTLSAQRLEVMSQGATGSSSTGASSGGDDLSSGRSSSSGSAATGVGPGSLSGSTGAHGSTGDTSISGSSDTGTSASGTRSSDDDTTGSTSSSTKSKSHSKAKKKDANPKADQQGATDHDVESDTAHTVGGGGGK